MLPRLAYGSRRSALALVIGLFVYGGGGRADAQAVARPASRGVVPPPAQARSLVVIEDGAPVKTEPQPGAERRGTVAEGTRLPMGERLAGEGCPTERWYRIAPHAYLCEGQVRPSPRNPAGAQLPRVESGKLLPHRYAFVRWDAARAYGHPSDYFADQYIEALGEGFGVVMTGRTMYRGIPFVRTRRDLWVLQEALRPVRASDFAGIELGKEGTLDVGWALRPDTTVHTVPGGSVQRRLGRREVVHVASTRGGWVRLRDGGWVPDRSIARARRREPPDDVATEERWLDVDVQEQVLVAWKGKRPVYATLVSTGRARPSHRTPKGTFRIWVKLAFSDMDDLERTDVNRNYAIEQVPWVQYFDGANGFHAAFWHDDFGRRRSHGCVNLSARDARWLFRFTGPRLPAGWYAILPIDSDPGTVVRVR